MRVEQRLRAGWGGRASQEEPGKKGRGFRERRRRSAAECRAQGPTRPLPTGRHPGATADPVLCLHSCPGLRWPWTQPGEEPQTRPGKELGAEPTGGWGGGWSGPRELRAGRAGLERACPPRGPPAREERDGQRLDVPSTPHPIPPPPPPCCPAPPAVPQTPTTLPPSRLRWHTPDRHLGCGSFNAVFLPFSWHKLRPPHGLLHGACVYPVAPLGGRSLAGAGCGATSSLEFSPF